MPMWHKFLYIINDNTNNKCITTNVLAELVFQDHSGQKSGVFQDK